MQKYYLIVFLLFYSSVSSFAQFSTVGTAVADGNCFELTQMLDIQIGAVWSNSTIDLGIPFTLSFNMDIGDIASGADADGIAFVMQQDGLGFIGAEGGNLGYVGNMGVFNTPNNSLGVAFKTYVDDVLGIWANSVADISGSPYLLPPVSGIHPVTISWDPATTTLNVDFDNDGIDLSWTNDIVNNYFGGDPVVFWGFTSANFVATPVQSVCDIQMMVVTPIPTMGEWGLILFALLMLNVGTLAMLKRKQSLAIAGTSNSTDSFSMSISNMPFDAKSYGRILLVALLLVIAGFTVASALFGYSLTNADIPGVLVCTPVLSYLLYLLAGMGKKGQV